MNDLIRISMVTFMTIDHDGLVAFGSGVLSAGDARIIAR